MLPQSKAADLPGMRRSGLTLSSHTCEKIMKRTKTIKASDTSTVMRVVVTIDSADLMRDEATAQLESVASNIMDALTRTPYANLKLSRMAAR